MKKFNIVFVLLSLLLFFNINSSLLSSDNDSDDRVSSEDNGNVDANLDTNDNEEDKDVTYQIESLSDIFKPYIDIIAKHTDPTLFLKGWSSIEYLKFLDILVNIHTGLDKYYKKYQAILNDSEPLSLQLETAYKVKMMIFTTSVFSEIFGGVSLKNEVGYDADPDIYFIPESMLDSSQAISEYFDHFRLVKKHDGVLIGIQDDNLYVYNVFESKSGGNFNSEQSKGVFYRWSNEGVFISKRFFRPENIYLLTSPNRFTDIRKTNYLDFERILYVAGINVNPENKNPFILINDVANGEIINKNILKNISEGLVEALSQKNTSELLKEINYRFVRRVLMLLKNYILIYNSIPSLDEKLKDISFYKDGSKYIGNNWKMDVVEIKDLVLSLYSIYHSDVLYPIFQNEAYKFFIQEEIDTFYSILNEDSFVSIITSCCIDDIVETLVDLLGEDHKNTIELSLYENNILFRNNKAAYIRELHKKIQYLTDYFEKSGFTLENIKQLILNNLDNFIVVSYDRLAEIMKFLDKHFAYIGSKKLKYKGRLVYKFLNLYFRKLLTGDLIKEIPKISMFIAKTFMYEDRNNSLTFLLNNVDSLENLSFETFKRNYTYLSKFFVGYSQEHIHNLFLSNIHTLFYLKRSSFDKIVSYLTNDLQLSIFQIQTIIMGNFPKLHKIAFYDISDNVKFISQYLESIDYPYSIYEIIRTRLYKISYLNANKANEILNFLDIFLENTYRLSLYRWLIDGEEDFRDLSLDKVKQAVTFLMNKLEDKNLVQQIVSGLDKISYLDIEVLDPLISRIFTIFKDKEMLYMLFKKGLLHFNYVLPLLINEESQGILEEEDRSEYMDHIINNWITSQVLEYYKDKICRILFIK